MGYTSGVLLIGSGRDPEIGTTNSLLETDVAKATVATWDVQGLGTELA
jgi:hypothetical protein